MTDRKITTISISKEVVELIEPFLIIKDPMLGIEATITRSAFIEALIRDWHQKQLDKIGDA